MSSPREATAQPNLKKSSSKTFNCNHLNPLTKLKKNLNLGHDINIYVLTFSIFLRGFSTIPNKYHKLQQISGSEYCNNSTVTVSVKFLLPLTALCPNSGETKLFNKCIIFSDLPLHLNSLFSTQSL